MKLDVLPVVTLDDVIHSRPTDAKLTGERIAALSLSGKLTNLTHVVSGQLGVAVSLSLVPRPTRVLLPVSTHGLARFALTFFGSWRNGPLAAGNRHAGTSFGALGPTLVELGHKTLSLLGHRRTVAEKEAHTLTNLVSRHHLTATTGARLCFETRAFAVFRFVTATAQRKAVRHIKAQFWKLIPGLDVMSMKMSPAGVVVSAPLASEVVALKDSILPLVVSLCEAALLVDLRNATLPVVVVRAANLRPHRRRFGNTTHPLRRCGAPAIARAIHGIAPGGGEFCTTFWASALFHAFIIPGVSLG
jgi:hypothetical protein